MDTKNDLYLANVRIHDRINDAHRHRLAGSGRLLEPYPRAGSGGAGAPLGQRVRRWTFRFLGTLR